MKKKITLQKVMFLICLFMAMILTGKREVFAEEPKEAMIDGVKYILYEYPETPKENKAFAYIDDVRGDHLPKELYIPKKITYQGKKYEVFSFFWGEEEDYIYNGKDEDVPSDFKTWDFGVYWRKNVEIPDKARSYHACLRKITFAKGVWVTGPVYAYDQLRQIVFKDKRDQKTALYNYCPKLKKISLPKTNRNFIYHIQNCPSLKITIARDNRNLEAMGKGIYWKKRGTLYNAFPDGKKYKVKEGIRTVDHNAFWGNETVEKIYFPDSVRVIGRFALGAMPNLKFIRFGKNLSGFNWRVLLYSGRIKRMDFPEKTTDFYYPEDEGMNISPVSKVYIRAEKLKNGNLKKMPETTTFYVKNHRVEKQLRRFGFRGKIIIQPKMKKYDKIKWRA